MLISPVPKIAPNLTRKFIKVVGNGSGLAHLTKKYIKFLKTGKKISKKILYFLP